MNNLFRISQLNNLLRRERIEELLREGIQHDMVSLISPSGYGKTQSAAAFLSDLDAHVIWIAFTELDNYTDHFWSTLCDALEVLGEEFSRGLRENGFPYGSAAMNHFIRRYGSKIPRDKPVIFVLDDCHLIRESLISSFILSMVSFEMRSIRIFFLSRPDTMLNTEEVLKGRSVLFINEQTLAFTPQEIREYLHLMGFPPSVSIVSSIYRKTEGWPIAVYLLVLYTKENPVSIVSSEHFTYAILDDLINTELFSTYSKEQQDLLLKLSVLEEIPVLYLEEIHHIKDITEISSNMLIRYNPHSKSYQFHQMFRDFLQKRFLLWEKTEVEKTYRAASLWFRKYDRKIDALYFYRKLRDDKGIWKIIWETMTNIKMSARELLELLLEIVDEYQEDLWVQNAWIPFVKANFYSQLGKYDKSQEKYHQIIHQQYKFPLPANIVGEALMHNAFLRMLHGDVGFRDYFRKARKYLPEGSVISGRGRMILLNGESVTLCEGRAGEMERWVDAMRANDEDANVLIHGSMQGMADVAAAQACYHRGEIDQAERCAMCGLERAKENMCVDIVGNAYYILMKTAMFYGDYERARRYIKASYRYARENSKNTSYNMPEISEVFFYSEIGKSEKVMDWIINDSAYSDYLLMSNYGLERILKGHYFLRKKCYNELFVYLDVTRDIYRKSNRFTAMIYIHLLYCFAYYRIGEQEKAVKEFETAYKKSYPNRIIMPFVEMGRFTRGFIDWVQARQIAVDVPEEWLVMIRAKASTYRKRMISVRQRYDREYAVNEEPSLLTSREKELLVYMGQGLTREEISRELHISSNTVKSNLKLVYAKLGAVNGVHAMHIAMSSGLLES